MKNKINIAELLKNCPQGMELDSTMFDTKVIYQGLNKRIPTHPIVVQTEHGFEFELTQYGQIHNIVGSKCVIFPKGKTTWEGFVPPIKFKNGDIITNKLNGGICIFKKEGNDIGTNDFYCGVSYGDFIIKDNEDIESYFGYINHFRLATEKEKQKLFDAIKDNGYKWNAETKTLEKLIEPKFKVGDIIQDNEGYKVEITSVDIDDECYIYQSKIVNGIGAIDFKDQDEWELVPNKFDVSTLIPFESKVLIRDFESQIWKPAIFGGYIDDYHEPYKYVVVGGSVYQYLIPYEGNEHLRCKIEDCNEYYKTWKE